MYWDPSLLAVRAAGALKTQLPSMKVHAREAVQTGEFIGNSVNEWMCNCFGSLPHTLAGARCPEEWNVRREDRRSRWGRKFKHGVWGRGPKVKTVVFLNSLNVFLSSKFFMQKSSLFLLKIAKPTKNLKTKWIVFSHTEATQKTVNKTFT